MEIALIIIGIVIVLVGILILFLVVRNKIIDSKVKQTSMVLKKIDELNQKFPVIVISYPHVIRETVTRSSKRSYENYTGENAVKDYRKAFEALSERRNRNHSLFLQYKRLYEETLKNVTTDFDVIHASKVKETAYLHKETKWIQKKFLYQDDSELIKFYITKSYTSPAGRNTYQNTITLGKKSFGLKDHLYEEIQIDYQPYDVEALQRKQEEATQKQLEEERRLQEQRKQEEQQRKEAEATLLKQQEQVRLEEAMLTSTCIDGLTFELKENGTAKLVKAENTSKTVEIPSEFDVKQYHFIVSEIYDEAFANNETIEKVVLPRNLIKIGKSSFRNCTELKEVVFNDALCFIGERAFQGNQKLKEVRLPDDLLEIQTEAFSMCTGLESFSISSKTKTVAHSILWFSVETRIIIRNGKEPSSWDRHWNVDDIPVTYPD